eukprot:TRINITY_DN46610_c0_g1_i1.p1 TRINITY_DN46610_c0_g1~~TRINITY_DN46610_c0_g1_i1.p1  ORF type:complete len:187 (-),score=37.04 TRINITY_DN46610_c0_g1_i1:1-561(-)
MSGPVFFFFQAEDGIRDAQESRGLGDVYKRQSHALLDAADVSPMTVDALPRTPYGVLCRSWVELAGVDASSVHSQRTTMTTTVSDDDLEVRSNTNTTTTTTTTTTTASPSSLPPTATTTTLPPPPPSKDPKRIVEAPVSYTHLTLPTKRRGDYPFGNPTLKHILLDRLGMSLIHIYSCRRYKNNTK